MTAYEAFSLMLAFGVFVIVLLSFNQKNNPPLSLRLRWIISVCCQLLVGSRAIV
ncbi:putative holin-like toxin [Bacillus aerolatus]|uniref:putative holin-like toxin n=1 Tax=Bacillus aerolatus TaxID=2653354 RepID=UPI001CDCFAF6